MSRRKKLTAKYTPLSLVDKIIYFIWALSIFATVILGFIGLGVYIPKIYAFNQEEIIAGYNFLATILTFPFIIYLSGIMLFCWISLYNKKQPFFGNKNYKPQGPTIKTYPLFSKEFKLRPKKQRKRQTVTFIVCVVVLVVTSLLYLLGLANREVITCDYTIEKYNSFNQIKDERKIDEAEEVLIYVKKSVRRGGRVSYNIVMKFSYEDDYYDFGLGSFFGNDEEMLNDMILIKENIPKEKIQIDTEYYQKLINYHDYNEKETELIYELFSK